MKQTSDYDISTPELKSTTDDSTSKTIEQSFTYNSRTSISQSLSESPHDVTVLINSTQTILHDMNDPDDDSTTQISISTIINNVERNATTFPVFNAFSTEASILKDAGKSLESDNNSFPIFTSLFIAFISLFILLILILLLIRYKAVIKNRFVGKNI